MPFSSSTRGGKEPLHRALWSAAPMTRFTGRISSRLSGVSEEGEKG